jgi:ABC-type uncharacterized transport system permease subunit
LPIAFLFQSLIAALCFWSEKASALERLQFIPFVFLSGLLAPLTAFPPEVRAFCPVDALSLSDRLSRLGCWLGSR